MNDYPQNRDWVVGHNTSAYTLWVRVTERISGRCQAVVRQECLTYGRWVFFVGMCGSMPEFVELQVTHSFARSACETMAYFVHCYGRRSAISYNCLKSTARVSMAYPLVECIPNFSEGRRPEVVELPLDDRRDLR